MNHSLMQHAANGATNKAEETKRNGFRGEAEHEDLVAF